MAPRRSHPPSASLLVLAAVLAACSGDGPGYSDPILGGTPTARVRIANAAPAIASTQMLVNNTPVGPTVARWTSSFDCQTVAIGQPITFRANGSDETLATIATPDMTGGGSYTIVLWGPLSALRATVLSDANLPAPSSTRTGLRFFNTTSAPGDVYVTLPDADLPEIQSVPNLGVGEDTEGGTRFVQYPLTSTQVRMFDVGVRTGTPRVAMSVSQTATSGVRSWTVVLTEEAALAGVNQSFLVAPCED